MAKRRGPLSGSIRINARVVRSFQHEAVLGVKAGRQAAAQDVGDEHEKRRRAINEERRDGQEHPDPQRRLPAVRAGRAVGLAEILGAFKAAQTRDCDLIAMASHSRD
jgi:hypothetical protein